MPQKQDIKCTFISCLPHRPKSTNTAWKPDGYKVDTMCPKQSIESLCTIVRWICYMMHPNWLTKLIFLTIQPMVNNSGYSTTLRSYKGSKIWDDVDAEHYSRLVYSILLQQTTCAITVQIYRTFKPNTQLLSKDAINKLSILCFRGCFSFRFWEGCTCLIGTKSNFCGNCPRNDFDGRLPAAPNQF